MILQHHQRRRAIAIASIVIVERGHGIDPYTWHVIRNQAARRL